MSADLAVIVAILLPLVGAVGIAAAHRFPSLREGITFLTAVLTFWVVTQVLGAVWLGERPGYEVMQVLPGLRLAFSVEPLGMVYALVASGLWLPTSLYAVGYMRGHGEKNQTRFYACFALAIFAALGIAFAANLFTLFLFYEILTFSTFPLVTHHGTEKAKRAGRIYLGILVGTSVSFLLFAIVWTYAIAGTLEFTPGGIFAGKATGVGMLALLALYAFGTGKAALMPFHAWLPNAMVAPTPVSALLHAVAVVKAGVFTVLKISVYVFGIDYLHEQGIGTVIAWVAAATILIASVIAIRKDNLKARLAYSTVSQLSYIVLGAMVASPAAAIGAGMHIATHAVGKITLFFCAGAIMVAAHKTEVSELDGLGRKMPFTFGAFFIGSLSIIGLPPFGGAWSKWYLAVGAADTNQMLLVAVLMASSLLSIAYLMPVVVRAFFYPPRPEPAHAHASHAPDTHHGGGSDPAGPHQWRVGRFVEAPITVLLPPVVTAIGCGALFVYGAWLYALVAPIGG